MKCSDFNILKSSLVNEALKPSQYRDLVKGWDKERYKDIFTNDKYEHDRNGYRVFLPIDDEQGLLNRIKNSHAYNIVEKELEKLGYDIQDYIKGIAVMKNNRKRMVKIGKLLRPTEQEKAEAYTSKNPSLKPIAYERFVNDENRQSTQKQHEVVISRHPYDIAGMSTDRGWTSCMNLENGLYKRYVPLDIKHGTVIAYAIRKGDRNIQNPVARVLIKPFMEINEEKKESSVLFGIEDRVYGEEPPGFVDTVESWVDEVNDIRTLDNVVSLKLHPELYADSSSNTKLFVRKGKEFTEEEQIKIVSYDPYKIEHIKNPSEKVQLAAIKKSPNVIGIINNLTDKMAHVAVSIDAGAIVYIDNPSRKLMEIAVKNNPIIIRHIDNPPMDLIQYAIGMNPGIITRLDNISELPEEVILTAIENDDGHGIFQYIHSLAIPITREMAMAAVKNNGYAIQYIDAEMQDEKMQRAAVESRAMAIGYCDNPSLDLMKYAIKNDSDSISNIKNPPKEIQMMAVKYYPKNVLSIVDNLDPDVLFYAIKKDPFIAGYASIRHLLTDRMKEFLVKNDPLDIIYIRNPSEELQLIAIRKDPTVYRLVTHDATDKVTLEAVKRRGENIKHVHPDKQTEELQIIAIKDDIFSYNYITNPTEKVQKLYDKLLADRKKVAEEYA